MASAPDPARAGVLGLGLIGSRVAGRLAAAGLRPAVWNRTPRADPPGEACATPAAVAARAGVLQLFVADDAAVAEVLADLAPLLGPDHVVCVHSTVAPATMFRARDLVVAKGAGFLDAPFTGSRDAAAQGGITYYVGGEEAARDRARPVLEASSVRILPVGPVGHATALKLATNILSAASVAALAEAVALLEACEVDPFLLQAALETNAARSPVHDMKLPAMLQEDFAPSFSNANMRKDLRDVLEAAGEASTKFALVQSLCSIYSRAAASGLGQLDTAALIRLMRRSEAPGVGQA